MHLLPCLACRGQRVIYTTPLKAHRSSSESITALPGLQGPAGHLHHPPEGSQQPEAGGDAQAVWGGQGWASHGRCVPQHSGGVCSPQPGLMWASAGVY